MLEQEKVLLEKKSAEREIALELFAEQKIEKIEKIFADFNYGADKQIMEASQSVNLDAKEINDVKSALDLDRKSSEMVGEAKKLTEKMKARIKKFATIGMAMMAFGVAGDYEKNKGGGSDNIKVTSGLAEKNKTGQKDIIIDEIANFKVQAKMAELEIDAEKMKNASLEHVASFEYLDRLSKELDGDLNGAKKLQEERLANLAKVSFSFLARNEMKRLYGVDDPAGGFVAGFYDNKENKIFIAHDLKSRKRIDEVIEHELQHASTGSDKYMTKRAKDFFATFHNDISGVSPDMNSYFRDYREKMAWKMEADLELERLGIKKYGEVFTKKHYKLLREKCDAGNLSNHIKRLLETIREADFIEMFNEIATNENTGRDFVKQA
jgi:hypothetical protein